MMRAAVVLLLAGCMAPAPVVQPTPTPALVGSLNPAVTQATIHDTVCVVGSCAACAAISRAWRIKS